jgi:hypothetical protein
MVTPVCSFIDPDTGLLCTLTDKGESDWWASVYLTEAQNRRYVNRELYRPLNPPRDFGAVRAKQGGLVRRLRRLVCHSLPLAIIEAHEWCAFLLWEPHDEL